MTAMPLSMGGPPVFEQATTGFSNGRHSLSAFSSWRDGRRAVLISRKPFFSESLREESPDPGLLIGAGSASPSSPGGEAPRPARSGLLAYSLIEVLIAGAILVIGISAAAILANTLLVQEESNGYSLRAFNSQEQAARLWQLGVATNVITDILPERCSTNATNPGPYSMYLGFTTNTTNLGSGVIVEILNPLRIVYHSGFDGSNNLIYRTNDVTVVRQTNR